MLATALEIVAKKLVDILGNKAAKLGEKDKNLAASYEAYYALRRIEETFAKISHALKYPRTTWSSVMSEDELRKVTETHIREEIKGLSPEFDLLAGLLEDLKAAFKKMEGKLEIYGSIEQAQSIRLYMNADDDVLRALFNYGEMPSDVRVIASNMITASSEARATIANFIRENYKIGEREDGR